MPITIGMVGNFPTFAKTQESDMPLNDDTSMQRLIRTQIVRQAMEAKEATRWEADYVLRAERDGDADWKAYLEFAKQQGFIA
jgi:hypothetical protein